MTDDAIRWSGYTASARGAQHVRTGLVNQDAVAVVATEGPVPATIAAVADGHGGARYVRSDVGSQLAVRIACEVGARLLASSNARAERRQVQRLLAQLIAELVDTWRREVLAHVAAHPFTPEEATTANATLATEPLVSYGCTVLVAALTPTWIGLAQVGDGDVLVIDLDGATVAPVPGDSRLVGGETTSLCMDTAVSDARYAVLLDPLPAVVMLATDGYGNSFASPEWRDESGAGFAELLRTHGADVFESRLPEWLQESADAGGDDVTMALLVRADHTVTSAAPPLRTLKTDPAGPVPSVGPPGEAAPRSRGRGRTIGAAALGLVAGLVAGRVLWPSDPAGSALVPAATSSTTATSVPTGATPSSAGGQTTPETSQPTTTSVPVPSQSIPPATTVPVGADLATIVAPDGRIIEFSTGPTGSQPRVVQQRSLLPTTALWWSAADWVIDLAREPSRLERRPTDGSVSKRVRLNGREPGGLEVAAGSLWVVSADGGQLAQVDATGDLVGDWVEVSR